MKSVIMNHVAGTMIAAHMTTLRGLIAFDPGKAGWKIGADGKIEMKDGNPIWVDVNGGESPFSGDTIAKSNADFRTMRTRAETAEATAKQFEGIDAAVARKAIDTVSKFDAKKLIDAGEVDKVRNEISQQFITQIAEKDKAITQLSASLDGLQIDNIFSQSDFIREKIAVPQDMFQATFRNNFKMIDGKPQAFDKSGNRVMSKKNIGDYADPQEAIEILVDQHPQKATILKASDHNGSGNNGDGGNRGGGRVVRRAEFDKLMPNQQAAIAAQAGKGELQIID